MATLEIETTNMRELSEFINLGTQKFNFDIRLVNHEEQEDFETNKTFFTKALTDIDSGKTKLLSDQEYKKAMDLSNAELGK